MNLPLSPGLRQPLTMAGLIILLVITGLMALGPLLVSNDPVEINMEQRLSPPSFDYPLGTDHFGRCIFSRLVQGAQITLGTTSAVIVVILCVGVPLGLLSGYIGGRVDAIFMRLVDGLNAFPEFILAIAVAGFLGPSLTNILLAIVAVKWIGYARLVRGIVLSEKNKPYIAAAQMGGTRTRTILIKHLLPHVLPAVLVLATLDMGKVILMISALSYLGLGAQPPTPEWGAMLNEARPYFQTAPSLMVYPGLAIMLVVSSCNLIGDGLRDGMDVRQI